jgi:hypothetical protein
MSPVSRRISAIFRDAGLVSTLRWNGPTMGGAGQPAGKDDRRVRNPLLRRRPSLIDGRG